LHSLSNQAAKNRRDSAMLMARKLRHYDVSFEIACQAISEGPDAMATGAA
jgi:hypothetical protein